MILYPHPLRRFTKFWLLIFPLLTQHLVAQTIDKAPITHTFFLIGDAGKLPEPGDPFGPAARKLVSETGRSTTVLFLGDNIYPAGLPPRDSRWRERSEKILQSQVDIIKGLNVNGIIIPGNHDWAHWGRRGMTFVDQQQQWVDSLKDANLNFMPRDACPGPVEIEINKKLVMLILDTQWLLHQWDKPGEDGPCEYKTAAEVLAAISDVFARNEGKRIIVAAHHPLLTYGEHGGVFNWKDHLFPLTGIHPKLYVPFPVVGSFYPFYRKFFGHIQDTRHPVYKEFAEPLMAILKENPGSIFVAGHEHALQYIVKDSSHHIVSGTGSKITGARKKGYSKFAKPVRGLARLSVHDNGELTVDFFQIDREFPEGKVIYTETIPADDLVAENASVSPAPAVGATATASASEQYRAGSFQKKMLGENYRKEWAQPLSVPVFDIGAEHGGLTILQKGGGQQTLSLRLGDATGHEYVIRSIEKYPEQAVPEIFRKTFAQDLVQDQISAAHPYAALVIPTLAEAAGIYHTNPKLMFVPDDLRLGIYRKAFANTLVLFEERPAGNWSEYPFFGNSKKIVNTSKVLEALYKDNDNAVDAEFVLKSRLFDLVIGDWDRHDDQWRWATMDSKKGDLFRPIPRDRDQAFFVNEGLLAKLWSRRWALPKFEGFDGVIEWPSGLSFNARYFDRTFLTSLPEDTWRKAAGELRARLTDEVIEKAIRQWPAAIYEIHGDRIVRHLKQRRDNIEKDAIRHYKFLSREVDVVGSDKREQFSVERNEDGSSRVQVFKITREGETGKTLYDRTFKPGETKEIRLYGLKSDDVFRVWGKSSRRIKVRIIGGEGMDTVSNSSVGGRTFLYDQRGQYALLGPRRLSNKTSTDPNVNNYDRKAFRYNRTAPLVYAIYNPDDGMFVGAGVAAIIHGFRKDPFKQRHILLGSVAPLTSSYNFMYQGKFTGAIGRWNAEVNLDVKAPNYVNNFFGMGNETIFDDDIEDRPGIEVDESIDYYRFRFQELRAETFLSRNFGYASFKLGPALQRIEVEAPTGDDRYIETFAATLPYNIFAESTSYVGGAWEAAIDRRDDTRFTKRGFLWNVMGRSMEGLTESSGSFSSFAGSFAVYHSFRAASRVTFALRVGGGLNTGDYKFYQAQVLDGRSELRGYRKTRFYGDSKFYSNLEMRVRLLSLKTYLFPASAGVLGFHDTGRVWYKDQNGVDPSASQGKSKLWHRGWGGGVWFTPFNMTVLSVEAGKSKDGVVVYARLGYLF